MQNNLEPQTSEIQDQNNLSQTLLQQLKFRTMQLIHHQQEKYYQTMNRDFIKNSYQSCKFQPKRFKPLSKILHSSVFKGQNNEYAKLLESNRNCPYKRYQFDKEARTWKILDTNNKEHLLQQSSEFISEVIPFPMMASQKNEIMAQPKEIEKRAQSCNQIKFGMTNKNNNQWAANKNPVNKQKTKCFAVNLLAQTCANQINYDRTNSNIITTLNESHIHSALLKKQLSQPALQQEKNLQLNQTKVNSQQKKSQRALKKQAHLKDLFIQYTNQQNFIDSKNSLPKKLFHLNIICK